MEGKNTLNWAQKKYARAFFRAMQSSLRSKSLRTELQIDSIETEALLYFNEYEAIDSDQATIFHIWLASLVLAAERQLKSNIPNQEDRLSVIQYALHKPNANWVKIFTRLSLIFSLDKFNTITKYTQNKVPMQYGKSFSFEHERPDMHTFIQRVTKCFYASFFAEHQAKHLTKVFCAFDKVWIDQIDHTRDKIAFSRPSTIADGNDSCLFQFSKID